MTGGGARGLGRGIEMTGDLLTGRDSELVAIRRALSGTGTYSGVVICGAAGVGKTRLAREVLARAQAAGERIWANWHKSDPLGRTHEEACPWSFCPACYRDGELE